MLPCDHKTHNKRINNFIVYVMAEKEEGASSSNIEELDQPAPINEETLVAKPRSTSIIWKYFGFEADERGKPRKTHRPICRLCQTEISAKDGNTTNLYSHLETYHNSILCDLVYVMDIDTLSL